MQIHRTAHSESAPAPHTDYKCTVHSCRYPQTHVVHRWPSSCSSANSIPPHPHPTHAHAHARSLSLSLTHTHTHTQGEGTVQWATGVEHKVSGSSTKFPSRSQLVACLLGRELHHTERRPAWSATSDLSARESAGGKERQTWRERQTEREWGLWSTSLYDSGWWNHSRTDWKMLALWMGDSVTIMCEFVCVCLLFCRS